jgi:hypothetical protein
MTDVMSHGVYPHDPLPGPLRAGMREVQTCGPYRAWVAPWGEMFTQRLSDGEWRRFPKLSRRDLATEPHACLTPLSRASKI